MKHVTTASASFADSKPHYEILDGLRGAVALMVLWYHVFEGFAFAQGSAIETFNHGHIGVDLFFMLSGFVISYAYDDRLCASRPGGMSMGAFFQRRLIRLHPMLIVGAVLGLIAFLCQGSVTWSGIHISFSWVMVSFLLTMLFVPAYAGAGYEVRGNGEMFPLNGPAWSLFFEYIGNILYALFIHRLSTRALSWLVAFTGALWAWFAVTDVSGYDSLGVGWALDTINFFGGLLRMLFPFTLGMLMSRKFRPIGVRGSFWWICAALFALFSVPAIPSDIVSGVEGISWNSLYELFCVAILFPPMLWMAASDNSLSGVSHRICRFLGDISYPLYIVHYPVMYLFYAWLIDNGYFTMEQTWPAVVLVLSISIALAYVSLRFIDEPIRAWLRRHA